MLVMGTLFSTVCLAKKPENSSNVQRLPADSSAKRLDFRTLANCIDQRYRRQLNDGLIDAQAAQELMSSRLLPSIAGSVTAESRGTGTSPVIGSGLGSNSTSFGVTLTQQIINLAQWAELRDTHRAEEAAELDLEDQLLNVALSAVRPYYDYVSNLEQRAIKRKRIARLQKTVAVLRELVGLRIADSADLFASESELKGAEIQLDQLSADAVDAVGALRVALGLKYGEEIVPMDSGPERPPLPDQVEAEQIAKNLPAYRRLGKLVESFDAGRASAQLEWLPTVSLLGNYNHQLSPHVDLPDSFAVAASLSWNVFDQGSRSIRARQSVHHLDAAMAREEAKALELDAQIRSELFRNGVEQRSERNSRVRFELATKSFDVGWTLFSAGKKSFVAMTLLEEALANTELELTAIRNRLAQSNAKIWLWKSYHGGVREVGHCEL